MYIQDRLRTVISALRGREEISRSIEHAFICEQNAIIGGSTSRAALAYCSKPVYVPR